MSTGDKDNPPKESSGGFDSARRSVDHSRLFHQEQMPAYAIKVNNTSFTMKTPESRLYDHHKSSKMQVKTKNEDSLQRSMNMDLMPYIQDKEEENQIN